MYISRDLDDQNAPFPKRFALPVTPLVNVSHCMSYGPKMLYWNGKSTPGCAAAAGTMVTKCGGSSFNSVLCSNPAYDPPHIVTLPLQYDCLASHSTTSYPSLPSFTNGSNSPPEFPRPRTSTSAYTDPCLAKYTARSGYESPVYGVNVNMTGSGFFWPWGRNTAAFSFIPPPPGSFTATSSSMVAP